MSEIVTPGDFERAGLDDWRYLSNSIHARFSTGDFVGSMRLAQAVAAAAEEQNHHPDLVVRWGRLDIALSSHDAGGVTDRDLTLARRIGELAAEQKCQSLPGAVAMLELALDTPDHEEIKPFWRAALAMTDDRADDRTLIDPAGSLPPLWFQESDLKDAGGQRFHLDVFVPHDQAEARVTATVAAGGRLVTDEHAPGFWVLADAQGNHVCVCTAA
ncbi:MAG: 4a-hydroxytetrahydrobiopterin dehydratase [Nocardioides sp.]